MRTSRFPQYTRFLILFLLLLPVACLRTQETGLPPAERVDTPTPAYARAQEVSRQTTALLQDGDTKALEALAAQLRKSGEAMDAGTWMLSRFYDSAVVVPDEEPAGGEAVKFYEAWAARSPDSITAQICLARAYIEHAWNARGGGYADTVTDNGWRSFDERLEKAWEVLDRADKLEEKCPVWYSSVQSIALGRDWDRTMYLNMVSEALSKYPTYARYYTGACYWMLPRWHGEEGDFEKWLAERAGAYPPGEQDMAYARMVWMAEQMPVSGQIHFGPGKLDWERTKRGFEAWLEAKPENLMIRFKFTQFAVLAEDRETAREQFLITGGKYFPGIWKDDRAFEAARQFAFHGTPIPSPASPRQAKLQSIAGLDEKTLAILAGVLKYLPGLCGGVLAGLSLLILACQRRQAIAGIAVLLFSIVVGTAFGTLSTVVPALGLLIFLKAKNACDPQPIVIPSGWITLLLVISLSVLYIGLQFVASTLAFIDLIVRNEGAIPHAIDESSIRDGTVFAISISSGWIVFLSLLALCRCHGETAWRERLGLNQVKWKSAFPWLLVAIFIAFASDLLMRPFADERTLQSSRLMLLGIESPVPFFIALVIMAPIVEELIFRGYAYFGWINKLGLPGTAMLSSVLFTACHIQYGWTGLFSIFLMGMVLTFLRWKTGSIFPCIAVHFVNNLANLIYAFTESLKN